MWHEQERISRTYNFTTKKWQKRAITSLTSNSILYFNDSQLGSIAFNLPYNLMYRKQYLTNWDADFGKHPVGSDKGSGSKHEATRKVLEQDHLVLEDIDLVKSGSDSEGQNNSQTPDHCIAAPRFR